MTKQNFKLMLMSLVAAAMLTACSPGADSAKNHALNRYAGETITPGVGLGDIRLGKTTLKWIVENFGEGSVSTLVGDQTAIQVTFLDGQAAFLFIVSGACEKDADAPRGKLRLTRELNAFLTRFPSCGNLTLSSLSVSADANNASRSFFNGATSNGVRLGSPVSETSKHGAEINRAGQMVAAEGPDDLERQEFAGGIYFYHDGGAGPTADEMQSGMPLSPERLREIDQSRREAAKKQIVRRITIFLPE